MSAPTRLPIPLSLGPDRTPEQIRDWLTEHGNDDPEHFHGAVDDLMRSVLAQIRDGHPDPVGLARDALIVDSADFTRWFA